MRGTRKPLHVAIFGCGKMGMQHARRIGMLKSAELKGFADPFFKPTAFKDLFRDVKYFENQEDLLRELKPDVVHVCSPPSAHADLAKLAIEHGAHVYVEKPFALETVEAQSVISLANELGLRVCAGHQLLFEKPALKAQEFLREIRQIVHVESYFSFRQVRRSMKSVEQLMDILPHPVYLLLHFLRLGSNDKKDLPIELLAAEVKPAGNAHAILGLGGATGILSVTLQGRPIESFLRIVGTNGCLYADFVHGTITKLSGPGSSAVSIVLNPFSQAKQISVETTKALATRVLHRQKSYPGLSEIIGAFYAGILNSTPPPVSSASIIETVSICEAIGKRLKVMETEANRIAAAEFGLLEKEVAVPHPDKGCILVTGGTGFLGRAVISELRSHGWPVRVVARHLPPYSNRIPEVEYSIADLAEPVPPDLLDGVSFVVHCAAETSGGVAAHERNSIAATRNILEAASVAGVRKFIHISTLAVLKTGREIGLPIDESAPVDFDNFGRGPYVWGKTSSERLARQLGEDLDLDVRVIRPGPLVNFSEFEIPGRLGREVGPFFVAIGSRRSLIGICKVQTAARVIRYYLEHFEKTPLILNLVEPTMPKRAELVRLVLKQRPDLRALWIPSFIVRVMSPVLAGLQVIFLRKRIPVNISDAFASEKYRANLAESILKALD